MYWMCQPRDEHTRESTPFFRSTCWILMAACFSLLLNINPLMAQALNTQWQALPEHNEEPIAPDFRRESSTATPLDARSAHPSPFEPNHIHLPRVFTVEAAAQPTRPADQSPPLGEHDTASADAHSAVSLLDHPLPGTSTSQWSMSPDQFVPQADVEMFVGETRIFPAPDVARIAVGDGSVVHAAVADEREVVVFARSPGTVSLIIWAHDGSTRSLRVRVVHNEIRRLQHELSSFLERIPNARSAIVGDKLIIEGDDLSDADQERIADLARRYPNIVDFTGRVGWDRMVLIDVQVVELPRSRMRELGIRWDPSTTGGFNTGALWDVASGSAIRARPGEQVLEGFFPASGFNGFVGLNTLLSARLHALSQQGEAVLLAQPQLMARSGSTASFLAGGELPYTTIDANGNASTVFKPYGVTLDVTPRIDRTGTVRARIEVEVSAVDPVVNTPSGPALRTRRTATEFNVRSGQTIVISGFLSREAVRDVDGVPGLARIPILGALFRATRVQEKDTELAIFVTPNVVTSDNASLLERAQRSDELLDATFTRAPQLMIPVQTNPFLME